MQAFLKTLLTFVRQTLTSRLGHFLLVAHLLIVVYIFAQMTAYPETECHQKLVGAGWSMIAGRSFHWNDELLLTFVFLLDLPAVLISEIAAKLFLPLGLCDYSKSWLSAMFLLFFASIQWLLVGFGLKKLLLNSRSPKVELK